MVPLLGDFSRRTLNRHSPISSPALPHFGLCFLVMLGCDGMLRAAFGADLETLVLCSKKAWKVACYSKHLSLQRLPVSWATLPRHSVFDPSMGPCKTLQLLLLLPACRAMVFAWKPAFRFVASVVQDLHGSQAGKGLSWPEALERCHLSE